MSMLYLASPYTQYPHGRFWAFDQAYSTTAKIAESGLTVFCPVVYGHTLAQRMPEMPHCFWLKFCDPFMQCATDFAILTLNGWRNSIGVMHELNYFKTRGIRERYISTQEANDLSSAELRIMLVD